MKTSSLFLILLVIVLLSFFGFSKWSGARNYVTEAVFRQNEISGIVFDSMLYNYKRHRFDKPFTRIVLHPTPQETNKAMHGTPYHRTRMGWVKADVYGVKYQDEFDMRQVKLEVKDSALHIYPLTGFDDRSYIIYSPSIDRITANDGNTVIHHSVFDQQLKIEAGAGGKVTVDRNNLFRDSVRLTLRLGSSGSWQGNAKQLEVDMSSATSFGCGLVALDELVINARGASRLNLGVYELEPLVSAGGSRSIEPSAAPVVDQLRIQQLTINGTLGEIELSTLPKIGSLSWQPHKDTRLSMPVRWIARFLEQQPTQWTAR
ncbi:GIN domain-containing protein [Parapedobacter sp. DT-150]|uniref:GIN domain-containing protein n=1 Tax=Parapedobacter sp. DT-150 TaxID=3396162 RepID=UPI003F19484E